MIELDFEGKMVRELLGPADFSMKEAAVVLGRAIGKDDLQYVQISYDYAREHMVGAGMSESVADGMIELYRAVNDGTCSPTERRSAENTTPTSIEKFSEIFAQAYRGR